MTALGVELMGMYFSQQYLTGSQAQQVAATSVQQRRKSAMQYKKAISQTLQEPEVVLNLWAYSGEDGYIVRLAGRAYVMEGDDRLKLSLLRSLSKTDWLAAQWEKVPANFNLSGPDGQSMKGIAHASMLSDPASHAHLFGPLMENLATTIPEQMRCFKGDYVPFKFDLPEKPLTVTTVVMEYEDGRLEPMVSKN